MAATRASTTWTPISPATITDRSTAANFHRGFGNIWGVADEHLYDYALEQIDRDAASGKPFLMHLMTTSNHTPFTFPEGRIDLPRGRPGTVKYSDYAVGRFIEMARTKPWFKDTVFVLVAGHCASSKGRTSLPPENYHIPAIVYSPAHLAPRSDTRLASQIDLVSYPDAGRAFIATYQKLGYLMPDQLVVLSPGGKIEDWQLDAQQHLAALVPQPDALVSRAIAAYQQTARRARDRLLQHVNLSDGLRMR